MLRRLAVFCLLLCLSSMPVYALTLLQGEVEVADQSEDARNAAISEALRIVAGKVAGDVAAATHPQINSAATQPQRYLQRYEYRQELYRPVPGAPPQIRWHLIATFHAASVESLLLSAGYAVWSGDRPPLLLLLEVDGYAGDGDALNVLRLRAQERGLRLVFPRDNAWQGAAEQARAGDPKPLLEYTRRSGAGFVLTGTLQSSGSGDFLLLQGLQTDALRISEVDFDSAQTALINRALATLSRRYAEASRAGPVELSMRVRGLDSAQAYASLISGLSRSPSIKSVRVVQSDDSGLRLQLSVLGGNQRLDQALVGVPQLRLIDAYADPVEADYAAR